MCINLSENTKKMSFVRIVFVDAYHRFSFLISISNFYRRNMGNPMYGLLQNKQRQKQERYTEHYLIVSVPQPDDINLRQTRDFLLEVRTNCDNSTTICRLTPKSPEAFIDELLALIFPPTYMDLCDETNRYANDGEIVEEITCEIDLKVFDINPDTPIQILGNPFRTYFKAVVTKLLQNHIDLIRC